MLSFDNVVGNFTTVNFLRRDIMLNGSDELLLFHGVVGTGKTSTAKIYAMAYTCESPDTAGNPCGQCDTCKSNEKAMQQGANSSRIVTVNMGTYEDYKGLTELMDAVFVLQTSEKIVYILDEFHLLDDSLQSSFLTEVDNMQDNVKIIMTTTHPHRINKGLRSRSNSFMFSKLSVEESRKLINLHFGSVPFSEEVFRTLIASSGFIPRNIIKNAKFLTTVGRNEKEQLAFLQHISSDSFLDLMESTVSGDITTFKVLSHQMTELSEPENVYNSMLQFLLECIYIHHGDKSYGTPKFRKRVMELMTVSEYLKVMTLLDNTDAFTSAESLDLFLFKILVAMRPKEVASEITNVVAKAEVKASQGRIVSSGIEGSESNSFTKL